MSDAVVHSRNTTYVENETREGTGHEGEEEDEECSDEICEMEHMDRDGGRGRGGAGGTCYGRNGNLSDSLLLMSLSKFYMQKGNIEKIIPVINCVSDVSLRLLDWFVTNYAKKKNIIITKPSPDDNGGITYFNVYLSYRAQLKAYSKQYFDPFRRRDRIEYRYAKDTSIQTTIGQLNFFKWVLQNDIMNYIIDHANDIETDMMRSKNKKKLKRKAEKEKEKEKEKHEYRPSNVKKQYSNTDSSANVLHQRHGSEYIESDSESEDLEAKFEAGDNDVHVDPSTTYEADTLRKARPSLNVADTSSMMDASSSSIPCQCPPTAAAAPPKRGKCSMMSHISGTHVVRFD